ncbi:helix-turn-helix domain-containing protein [Radiobacillus sp. PE A8.2]|uniref:AraC family transcriptional regulator n=1 Tax=Radiobacillus sp. PE A8.2 TaxID=3380349 RepID=UPI00388E92AF
MQPMLKPDGFESEKLFVLPAYMRNELTNHPLTNSLFITDIGYFPKAQYHYRERSEGCDTAIFIYCTEGSGWVEMNQGEKITIERQTLTIIPTGTPHRYGSDHTNPWSIYWFHLKGNDVNELLHAFQLTKPTVIIPVSGFVKFVEWFDSCYNIMTFKPFSIPDHIHAAQTIRHLISSIGMVASRSNHKSEAYLEDAVNFMAAHIGKPLKLEAVATHIGLSKQHVIHVFNQFTGMPPIDFFLRMKMQRASQMLDLSTLSVKEVGAAVGYDDPYYFSRVFKKVMGSSPSHYRRVAKG